MEKKEYVAPEIIFYGNAKEITKSGGTTHEVIDSEFIGPDGQAYASYKDFS